MEQTTTAMCALLVPTVRSPTNRHASAPQELILQLVHLIVVHAQLAQAALPLQTQALHAAMALTL